MAPRRAYCSDDHASEGRKRRQADPPKADIACRVCGEGFRPYRSGQTLCRKAACRRTDTVERNRTRSGLDPAIRERIQHPTGYEPGAELSGDRGWVSSLPSTRPPERVTSWDWLLLQWHLEPAEYEVLEPVQIRTWLGAVGGGETQEFYYYKANVRRRAFADFGATLPELRARLRELRAPKPRPAGAASTFMLTIGDTQFGKADGDGTPGTVARVASMLERLPERVALLRDRGYQLDEVCVAWLGDLVENVDGHYAQQGFTTDLNLTQQVELATDTYLEANAQLARLFPRVLNVGVPGNHGEVRKDGKSYTNLADNFDTSSLRQGQKAIALDAGLRDRVRLVVPEGDELTVTLRIRDRVHTFLHGHQGRVSGPTAAGKIARWLEGQAGGMRAPGEADYAWSGHYHHFSVIEAGPRVIVQSPALDGGSNWFAQVNGDEAPPGTVTAVLTGEPGIAGLAELTVLAGDPMPPRFADLVRGAA